MPKTITTATDAATRLREGHLVIIPTETVYGVAADPASPDAVEALYSAKNRPRDKPIALLAASTAQVLDVLSKREDLEERSAPLSPALLDRVQRLGHAHWPGPLTLVIAGTGYRVPDHALTRDVISLVGHPILATSANQAGQADTITAAAAAAALPLVPYVLTAGPCTITIPSTVARITEKGLEILRAGSIAQETLQETIT